MRAADRSEIPELCELINRAEEYDGYPRRYSVGELEDDFDGGADFDACCAFLDGRLVGSGRLFFPRSGIGQERIYLSGEVDPATRGLGVGREVLGWQIARARALLATTDPSLPRFIRVEAYDFHHSAHRLYERFGLGVERWFEEMIVPLTDLPAPGDVDGVEFVGWQAERSEELRVAKNAAFAEHWGSAPMTAETWDGWITAACTRLDLSVLALERASGRIIGHCIVAHYPQDEQANGRREGWIDNVGTLPEWRGRGIASAMILRCLHAFVDEGWTHGALGVDVDNGTGAPGVYRNLGFVTAQRTVHRQLAL